MKAFRTLWLLVVGLAAVVVGLGRNIIADMLDIPRPPGQYVLAGIAVALAGLALAPIFLFRRR
jgi:F0F1-type ATP synthase membrane subunit c/vacuolar-type H+-ATPase subunit K